MLQPGSSISGGVTQCLLLNSASHAVASGIGSAVSTHFRTSGSAALIRVCHKLPIGQGLSQNYQYQREFNAIACLSGQACRGSHQSSCKDGW